jgi:nucleotidyltransferase substrate binding protein (TIGR01987 family)
MDRESADAERYQLQRQNFEKALARLEAVLLLDETEVVRDSIIQRFEFTFEMAWKLLFRYLVLKGERVAAKAWDVLPAAFEALLIDEPDVWTRLREYRNDTSHEYNQNKAIEVVAFVRQQGLPTFQRLRSTMAARA